MQARQGKRNRRLALALGTGLAAVLAAVAVVALGSTTDSSAAVASRSAPSVLTGIPQHGLTLGNPGAKVELIEFGDLTSPVSKQTAEEVLPKVIRDDVAKGKAKLVFRNFGIIGPQSTTAGAAAVAAGEQGHGWDFIEDFFSRQRRENSGYVTAKFLGSIAKASGVEDLAAWRKARNDGKTRAAVEATTKEATKIGLKGAPTFAVRGPRTHGLEILELVGGATPLSEHAETAAIEKAIAAAG
jgi:protein-disulfide isomerase